jgi:hypothetical protein
VKWIPVEDKAGATFVCLEDIFLIRQTKDGKLQIILVRDGARDALVVVDEKKRDEFLTMFLEEALND